MKYRILLTALLAGSCFMAKAQDNAKPEDTEFWSPEPPVVTPGKHLGDAPSDAIILFGGTDLNQWVDAQDRSKPANWFVKDGIITVNKSAGNMETKQLFSNYQLHVEWREPIDIQGTSQARGNSGVFLASLGPGDAGYELQVLDSYKNKTYVNGMAGSIYKQFIPLANPMRPPGEWNTYDVIWIAPTFNADGSVNTPARATVIFNGVIVQNDVTLAGPTLYIGHPSYKGAAHGPAAIKLQAHGDDSKPISYRNIWVRPLQ